MFLFNHTKFVELKKNLSKLVNSDAENAEDLDAKYSRMSSGVRTRWITPGPHRRARSESPYGKPGMGRKLKSTKLFDQARRDVDSLGPIDC